MTVIAIRPHRNGWKVFEAYTLVIAMLGYCRQLREKLTSEMEESDKMREFNSAWQNPENQELIAPAISWFTSGSFNFGSKNV